MAKGESYIELNFPVSSEEMGERLIASLSDIGFEGFEEGDGFIKAYIPYREYDEELVKSLAGQAGVGFTKTTVADQNWNEIWESQYEPVTVNDEAGRPWVSIRASFHPAMNIAAQELIITPKMSFGTGHHPTTFMMIEQMQSLEFRGKVVMDFGTGTAVLAILAEKLGASSVIAIDNDEWSLENSRENLERNNCSHILLENEWLPNQTGPFDIILANINRNIILQYLERLAGALSPEGTLVLSGLLEEDREEIERAASQFSLISSRFIKRKQWISIALHC